MLSVSTTVNSILSRKLVKETASPFHDNPIRFSATKDGTPAEFPTLNVVSLGEPTANTNTINPGMQGYILSTIQLKAFSVTTMSDARRILDKAGDVMFGMNYEMVYGPESMSDKSPYCMIARFRRVFSGVDIENLKTEAKKPIP